MPNKHQDGAVKQREAAVDVGAQLAAIVEALPKDSEDFRAVRNAVWRKVNRKEPDPELMKIFHEIVKIHTYEEARVCWNEIRKEQRDQTPED